MRTRIYFYEYVCDGCNKKEKRTQTSKKYKLPEGWEPRVDTVDKVVYTYCEVCKK